ncbi:MAG: ABC transporter substrate-binding protein [Alphaproteobacteria bacterium]|nr:ABC transporter substrate-binding protein [Alphaproteobacteria bacterium]
MLNRRVLLGAVCAATVVLATPAAMAQATGADEFIRRSGQRAIDSLTVQSIGDAERGKRFREILRGSFDVPEIGRFVLGRYWRTATDQEKTEYLRLFEDFIVRAYANRFADYSGETFRVLQVVDSTDNDKLVSTEIVQPSGKPPVRVVWRVRGQAGAFKVVDVTVEGISMSVTQRDEFAAVIRSNGGTVAGLLDALRKKTGN